MIKENKEAAFFLFWPKIMQGISLFKLRCKRLLALVIENNTITIGTLKLILAHLTLLQHRRQLKKSGSF